MKMNGSDVAIIGIMASMIIMAGYIPIIPIFGTGYTISLGSVLIQVVAVLLGPLIGALTVLTGSFSGMMVTGQGFQFLFFIPATIGALTTALLAWNRHREGILLFGASIILWYISPLGLKLWYYPYLHLMLFAIIVVWVRFAKESDMGDYRVKFISIALFCTAGVLCDHLLGSIIAMFPPFELPAEAYRFILFIYPIERIMIGVVSAVVAIPVLRAIQNTPLSIIRKNEEASVDTN